MLGLRSKAVLAPLGARSKSSIAALAYKALHKNTKRPPLPKIESPDWTMNAAISSILYETPEPRRETRQSHVFQCLVQDEPGVLALVSNTLAARGFNIDSLVVANTEVPDLSRMTVVLKGQPGVIEQARRQIEDLVPVWAVLDYTGAPLITRELVLAKVSLLGPEYFEELVSHHRLAQQNKLAHHDFQIKDFHPNNIAHSEALRHKYEHLSAIKRLVEHYGGKVADVSDRNCVVELCAPPEEVTKLLHHLKPFGVLEIARTGMSAMTTTPLDRAHEDIPEEVIHEELGDLPPG